MAATTAKTFTTGQRVEVTRGNRRGQQGVISYLVGEMHILKMDSGFTASLKATSLRAI